MNELISPVKKHPENSNLMSTEKAVSDTGQVPWGDFLCEEQRYYCSRKHKLYLYVYQMQYLVYGKQCIQLFSKPTRYAVLQGLQNIYGHSAHLYTIHTHMHGGNFLNSKVV